MKQTQALRVMLANDSVFLTGAPGAGKTYVLNQFIRRAKAQGKLVAVTASTGIAATHIGGTTIHSWSGLGIRDELSPRDLQWLAENDRLIKRYNSTDVLVIDEVSMLHGKRLDMVNQACKLLRKSEQPFGGLQVILVGDLFQLPPINRGNEALDFVYTSQAWQELKPKICYLKEQHRQQGGELLGVLEAMRRGELEDFHADTLNQRLGIEPPVDQPVTRLYSHNVDVESINDRHLEALDTNAHTFTMRTTGSAAKVEQLRRSLLAPEVLELKVGAEVMFVANNFGQKWVNGSRGRVVDFKDGLPVVSLLSNGHKIKVEPHTWALEEDGKKRAEAVQMPLRLAWAITIHKSQGMSLDAAQIDLSKSFTPGMGYVALSRVRNINGLYLTGINAMAMRLHPDIHKLDSELQAESRDLAATIPEDEPEEPTKIEPIKQAVDEALLSKLKLWRLARATADAVPPYVVAHNTVLETLCIKKPTTRSQLSGVKGFGTKTVEKYGDDIMRIMGEAIGPNGSGEQSADTTGWNSQDDEALLQLFKEGVPLDQVAANLDYAPEEIWQRLRELT
jgi:ATP-dependent DNA helicase PIF1